MNVHEHELKGRQQRPERFLRKLYDQIISLYQRVHFSPHVVQEAMQLPTIVSLVAAGIGVAMIPASLQNLRRTRVNYRTIRESTPKAGLVVAWRAEHPSALLQSFLRVVAEKGQDKETKEPEYGGRT